MKTIISLTDDLDGAAACAQDLERLQAQKWTEDVAAGDRPDAGGDVV